MQKILDSRAFFLTFTGCRHLHDEINICERHPSVWDGGLQSRTAGGCEEGRTRALPQHMESMLLECSGWNLCPEWPGFGPAGLYALDRLVTIHAQNFTSFLQLAPGGTGYVPRDWGYQQVGHMVEKMGFVSRNTLQPYKHGFHGPSVKNIRFHVSLATTHQ